MIFNLINFIRFLTDNHYDRFIKFLDESRGYPYFSSLYDMDDFNEDVEFFKSLIELYEGGAKNEEGRT